MGKFVEVYEVVIILEIEEGEWRRTSKNSKNTLWRIAYLNEL